jgi:hypothetical protein
MVKVLVGEHVGDRFVGFWAEFEGEEVSSYEDGDVAHTLYKCTAYGGGRERYRVHIANETTPSAPVFELHPHQPPRHEGRPPDYKEPFYVEDVAEKYPLFLKDIDYFEAVQIDPLPRAL